MMGTSNSVGRVERTGVGVSPEAELNEDHPLSRNAMRQERQPEAARWVVPRLVEERLVVPPVRL